MDPKDDHMTQKLFSIADFEHQLRQLDNPVADLRDQVIGSGMQIQTPFGPKKLIYADYIASGRAVRCIEDFVMTQVLPYYANSHTEQSFCGARMTQLREEARQTIANKCGATSDHAVIFGGSGATTGINQLVHLFGIHDAIRAGRPVTVIVGPYEHHSNLLPWRQSGARVVETKAANLGGVDLDDLERILKECPTGGLIIGAFSAASNVTGICTDPAPVSQRIKAHGGKTVWDYAGGGPYLNMNMSPGGVDIDAIVTSPHKFIGGPGASGVLILRKHAVETTQPSRPGGGTVVFVNAQSHDYVARLEQREEGGTPNVIGDIRAALAMVVKDVIGQDFIETRNASLIDRAIAAWGNDPQLGLFEADHSDRLPFLSFAPQTPSGERIDYKSFTTALSDYFGIQARGGCSCAGPYVHQLLSIDDAKSEDLRERLLKGDDRNKPGFVRLNLSYLMDDHTIEQILEAVPRLISQFSQEKSA